MSATKVVCNKDYVLLRADKAKEEVSKSGIVIALNTNARPRIGTVVASSSDFCQPGDRVIYGNAPGIDFEDCLFYHQEHLLAKVSE